MPSTFVVIAAPGFDPYGLNAAAPIRLGYLRAFAEMGARADVVYTPYVESVLPALHKPFVFLSIWEYLDMTDAGRNVLRNYPHFVWINLDDEAMEEIYEPHGITRPKCDERAAEYVLESEPDFVWTDMPPSGLQYCSFWQKSGLPLVSLPVACDTGRYYPEPASLKYCGAKMAYVGGYWPAKAIQFDKYLQPYEDKLTVFGYNAWPYRGFRGVLPIDDERVLYQNARVCPAIGTPGVAIGQINERIFKILGSGGLAVTDVAPAYRELFTEDELLVPESMDEYHDMIQQALAGEQQGYRERGRQAILERHTYAHRAATVLGYLNTKEALR